MGQHSSKPIRNQKFQLLKQYYLPSPKVSHFPGSPVILQQHPNSIKMQNHPKNVDLLPLLDLYAVELNLTQAQIIENQMIYQRRLNQLPWVVRVIWYDLQRKQCQCISSTCKFTVCTEHVETRLYNFRSKNMAKQNRKYEILESFSFQQAIYVLINALHGYQILAKQFKVNYPSDSTIGINLKGQIKVWFNENWALNEESSRFISQNQIVEEIINIVDDKTRDQLYKILNIRKGFLNFTFDSIQEMLAQFVIQFNIGRKTLINKIQKMGIISQRIPMSPSKFSLNRVKPVQEPHLNIINTSIKVVPKHQSFERRYHSYEIKNQKIQRVNHFSQVISNNNKPVAMPHRFSYDQSQRSTLQEPRLASSYESPKKSIKFTYAQTPSTQNPTRPRQSSPSISFHHPPVNLDLSISKKIPIQRGNSPLPQQQNHISPNFQKTNPKKIYFLSNTNCNNNIRAQQESQLINRKLFMMQESDRQTNKNKVRKIDINLQTVNLIDFKQPFKRVENISKIEPNIQSSSKKSQKSQMSVVESPFSKQQTIVSQEMLSSNSNTKLQSLNSITEEFRILLQSNKKIEENEFQEYSFSQTPKSQMQKGLGSVQRCSSQELDTSPPTIFYEKSQQDLLKLNNITQFYSIKQEEEDFSYQLESHKS